MLRSMIIGFTVAAVLQFGSHLAAPAASLDFAAQRIDWVAMQADAIDRLVCLGFTQLSQ